MLDPVEHLAVLQVLTVTHDTPGDELSVLDIVLVAVFLEIMGRHILYHYSKGVGDHR